MLLAMQLSSLAGPLLPFQGKLVYAEGAAVEEGVQVVQFKLYDAPVGGRALWNGEVHKLSVNAGLVNTVLGSKSSLDGVDFSSNVYLEITVDANGDDSISPLDPPLLPRQLIVSAVHAFAAEKAKDAETVRGFDIFQSDAQGAMTFNRSLFGNGVIPSRALEPSDGASSGIDSDQIRPGAVDLSRLAQQVAEMLVPVGSIVAYWGDDAPAGWVLCDGRSLDDDSKFDVLRKLVGNNTPDLRGQFLRGLDTSGNVDPQAGRQVGDLQEDAIEEHQHPFELGSSHRDDGDGAGYFLINTAGNQRGPGIVNEVSPNHEGASETRPKNVSVNFIIKY